jgi:hypothetical protein
LVREQVAENPACPPELLEKLARDQHWAVRNKVGGNPASPASALRYLASLEYPVCSLEVVYNPACPPDVLEDLLHETVPEIVQAAAAHPNLPVSTRAMWQMVRGVNAYRQAMETRERGMALRYPAPAAQTKQDNDPGQPGPPSAPPGLLAQAVQTSRPSDNNTPLDRDRIGKVFDQLLGTPARETDIQVVQMLGGTPEVLADYIWDHWLGEPDSPGVQELTQEIIKILS